MSDLDKRIKAKRRALENLDKGYEATIAKMKKEKASKQDIELTYSEWSAEYDVQEYELDAMLTQKIRARANELDLSVPPYPQYVKDDPDWDQNDNWYRNPMDGSFSLKRKGREYMDEVIWKKEERDHNRRIRWITLGIGLTGALTGLVSVTANNWEKFARIFQHFNR